MDIVTIVATAPRPGVDFIQSLFDGHPQVLTFDGWLLFNTFYNDAVSLFGTKKYITGFESNFDSTNAKGKTNHRDFFLNLRISTYINLIPVMIH